MSVEFLVFKAKFYVLYTYNLVRNKDSLPWLFQYTVQKKLKKNMNNSQIAIYVKYFFFF